MLNQDKNWEIYWRILFKNIISLRHSSFQVDKEILKKSWLILNRPIWTSMGTWTGHGVHAMCAVYRGTRIKEYYSAKLLVVPSYNASVRELKQKMNARKRRVRLGKLFVIYILIASKKNLRIFTVIGI